MKQLFKHPHYVLILWGLLSSLGINADTWENPGVRTYYSENKEFKLIVTPRIIPDKYYMWQYYKNDKIPQTKKFLRNKKKFMKHITAQDTIYTPCTAELYRMKGTDSVLVWKRTLLNYTCPVRAIIANDGSSVATMDNWYSRGYGVNVFVIYDKHGNAKKTYKLEEFTPFPLNDYRASISSLYWYDGVKYIDNDRLEIVFRTKDGRGKKRVYNTKKLEFEE